MRDRRSVARVSGLEDEDRLMGHCPCGGAWALAYNEVSLRKQAWVDHLLMRCRSCDARATFDFDVTGFFEARPGVGSSQSGRSRSKVIAMAPLRRAVELVDRVGTAA
jgi:hypothetical protein